MTVLLEACTARFFFREPSLTPDLQDVVEDKRKRLHESSWCVSDSTMSDGWPKCSLNIIVVSSTPDVGTTVLPLQWEEEEEEDGRTWRRKTH